jgi:hypothetical protein
MMQFDVPARLKTAASVIAAALVGLSARPVHAQGVTTAEIRGTVRVEQDNPDVSTRVRVTNLATGVSVEVETRGGRFVAAGLEIGGPYSVVVRRIGFTPLERRGIVLELGQPQELEFDLVRVPTRLDTITVVAEAVLASRATGVGVATTISDSLLSRLPTLNRDFYDFARLAPQISSKIGLAGRSGLSGGGVGFRFNNYLIDGTSDRAFAGNSSTAADGGKSVSIEAVQEYQVLLAPFDVRYGDFAGALINTVTRRGTNEVHGSAFGYWRSDQLTRQGDLPQVAPYDREQYGFLLAGPLVRDRIHFLVAPEVERLVSPAPGPYVGQPASASPALLVRADDVSRFSQIMEGLGLTTGSGDAVRNSSPLTNVFARLDIALPSWNSRIVASERYTRNTATAFSRASPDTFALSSYEMNGGFGVAYSSIQLRTNARGGTYNELIVSHGLTESARTPAVHEPTVQVAVPRLGGGIETLKAGSVEGAEDAYARGWSAALADNLTVPVGAAHLLALGAQVEFIGIRNGGVTAQYGAWSFSSLDSLQRGIADRFIIRRDFGSVGVLFRGEQFGMYAGDSWRTGHGLSLTYGLRADGLMVNGRAPYNPVVDTLFKRRTDAMPATRVQLSPRFGFSWDPSGAEKNLFRGGLGVFTGRPPLSWLHAGLYSYGIGAGVLQCGGLATDGGAPPPFTADYRAAPTACANGRTIAATPNGDVDLLDRHLRMAQTLRASLAYDRRLPWDALAAIDALLTRNISDFIFVNLNLKGPQSVDRHGRVLYGAISASGVAAPSLVSNFSEVIDLRNDSQNHSGEVSARLEKRFSHHLAMTASYTYTTVSDVQLPLRAGMPAIINWGSGRAVSGRHDDLSAETSLYDLPHRVAIAATYSAPWRHRPTDFSIYYVGESGSPITYVASGVGGRGDLNADGWTGNDPVYIPKSVVDTSEIRFGGPSDSVALQQSAFDRRIDQTPCLNRQRGRIMARNSCREPWSNTTIASLRQTVLATGSHALTAQLDVFNVLNLLRRDWGQYRVGDPALLQQVGEVPGTPGTAQPIFRFDLSKPQWTTVPAESAYQLQLSLRYSF